MTSYLSLTHHSFASASSGLLPTNSTFVLCGDFNFPRINWTSSIIVLTNENTCSGILLRFYYKFVLSQFVTQPTRYSTTSQDGSILDLVLCNDRNFVFNPNVDAPFATSDH